MYKNQHHHKASIYTGREKNLFYFVFIYFYFIFWLTSINKIHTTVRSPSPPPIPYSNFDPAAPAIFFSRTNLYPPPAKPLSPRILCLFPLCPPTTSPRISTRQTDTISKPPHLLAQEPNAASHRPRVYIPKPSYRPPCSSRTQRYTVIWLAPLSGFFFFSFSFLSVCSHTSSPFFSLYFFFLPPITHRFSFYHRQAKQARINERRGGREEDKHLFPAKYQPLLHGWNAFFFFNTFLYARYLFFSRRFLNKRISVYTSSLSLSRSLCSPSLHPPNSVFFFFWFGPLHPDMYNKTSSRAVTNRPCIQARYLIRFLSQLKCGLWCGEG